MTDSTNWMRARRSRALLGAALVMSAVLGAGFVAVNDPPPEAPLVDGPPLSDDRAVAQVVDAARDVVTAAQLRGATGGYTFISCTSSDAPPYQAALYMSFPVPESNPARRLDAVAAAMASRGWRAAAAGAAHFGHKLTREGMIAELSAEQRTVATLRVYGECRNMGDHRDDDPAWTEVTL